MPASLSFARFREALKAGQVAPVYLFEGEEAYFHDEGIRLLEQATVSGDALSMDRDAVRGGDISLGALLGVAAATSVYALVQFAMAYRHFLSTQKLEDDPTVLARITGTMGHWMTFSGEQLRLTLDAHFCAVATGTPTARSGPRGHRVW